MPHLLNIAGFSQILIRVGNNPKKNKANLLVNSGIKRDENGNWKGVNSTIRRSLFIETFKLKIMITESDYKKALEICRKYLLQKKDEVKFIENQLTENGLGLKEFKGIEESDLTVRSYNILNAAMRRARNDLIKNHWNTYRDEEKDDEFWYIDRKLILEFELNFLKNLTKKEIKSWRNCGKETFKELLSYLKSIGIILKD